MLCSEFESLVKKQNPDQEEQGTKYEMQSTETKQEAQSVAIFGLVR